MPAYVYLKHLSYLEHKDLVDLLDEAVHLLGERRDETIPRQIAFDLEDVTISHDYGLRSFPVRAPVQQRAVPLYGISTEYDIETEVRYDGGQK